MPTMNVVRVFLLAAAPVVGAFVPAKADFVIKGSPPAASGSLATTVPPVAMQPIVDPGDPGYKQTTAAPLVQYPATSIHWKMAYGFGNNVPLSFACRQIVPQAVKVTFGPGVSPQMIVSWKGGDTWNHVLRNAVTPIGLQLVMTHMAVEIRK